MHLSDGEKLIILMLTDIYKKIDVKGKIDPDFIQAAIFQDQLWGIKWKFRGIPFSNTEAPPVVNQVCDILQMWQVIEQSYTEFSQSDKDELQKLVPNFGKNPKFRGFDGNNECDHMGIADFLVNKLERFEQFKKRDFNSHSPTLAAYIRMLNVYKPIIDNVDLRLLNLQELTKVLNSQVHPSAT